MKSLALALALAVLALAAPFARAAEPLLHPNDTIALIGGEDMVAAAETGQLELLLQRAFPDLHLKIRSLAWEGDTVFDQPRDLNYPTLEQQLDDLGATVVVAQFGLMESLAGPSKLPAFTAAYEKLIARLGADGKRKFILVAPAPISGSPVSKAHFQSIEPYADAIRGLAQRLGARTVIPDDDSAEITGASYRDGLHLNQEGQIALARRTAEALGVPKHPGEPTSTDELHLADLIRAKHRLWFHYARPQNWAFLNGDRTIQPSSRDHLDPSKRWFPEEMKQWLPLIAAKEQEIWTLARQLAPK